jgi:hypothetical protein
MMLCSVVNTNIAMFSATVSSMGNVYHKVYYIKITELEIQIQKTEVVSAPDYLTST